MGTASAEPSITTYQAKAELGILPPVLRGLNTGATYNKIQIQHSSALKNFGTENSSEAETETETETGTDIHTGRQSDREREGGEGQRQRQRQTGRQRQRNIERHRERGEEGRER